jgi:hypothetical protein
MNRLQAYIESRRPLFWSVGDLSTVSDTLLVETILNYGSREDVIELFDIMGIERVADIFTKATASARHNYFPMVANFFKLYFDRHVYKHPVA